MPKNRNCYQDTFEVFVRCRDDPGKLVHGYQTLTRDDGSVKSGSKYGHAWIESPEGTMVMDVIHGSVIPKDLYYAAGNIDESECRFYTLEESWTRLYEDKIYGPWGR